MISFIHPSIYNRGCLLFLLGVAGFRRSIALQFLHQQFAAATQNVPELPQGAAAHEGSTTILQTHTQSSTHPFNTQHVLNTTEKMFLTSVVNCCEWLAAA